MSGIELRKYNSRDATATLAVFLAAVTETAARDYSPEQIAAWARPGQRELIDWDESRRTLNTYVAILDGNVAGFSDVSAAGYIDMMFVAPRYGRRGVGATLLSFLERSTPASVLAADVSITARPFFEAHGFVVEAEQHPRIVGVRMTNFRMTKQLRPGGLSTDL